MATSSDDLTTLRKALPTACAWAGIGRLAQASGSVPCAELAETERCCPCRNRAALDRLAAHLARLEAVAEALPQCSGEWIGGSGGHRVHSPCGRIATFNDAGGMWSYCDAHKKPHDAIDEADWADAVRALDAPARGEENPG